MSTGILTVWTMTVACVMATSADENEDQFTKRGPLDKHADLVQQVLNTLDLSEEQKPRLNKIVADGHAAWRAWYKENREKVDAYTAAIQAAKTSGDKKKLGQVRKEKKVFMHTAPSLLRKPEPVRTVLNESQLELFDERLLELKRQLHRPRTKQSSEPTKAR